MALTRRQKEVMDFIAKFLETHGYSPSFEEIAHGLNLASLATVHKHISALESKTYLRRGFNQSRSIELAPKYLQEQRRFRHDGLALPEVPLAGRIAAGLPVESVPDQATLAFSDFLGNSDTFALQVRGDSMIEDHICDGDYVLVERVDQVRDGEIVVALVAGLETTLKRLFREGNEVRLQPANRTMDPIIVPAAHIQIQGRVLAVLRKYR
jgi:repressor LexA